ncbi:ABC transporter substrate-binding protein [Nocardioides coralli]|uniref:ABC transporter substrate-binding protein n=1 Tax=Nocardioides coralli TaxID=2872154 RepID=UPI001CA3DDF6|nr:ABC transporter substrate-binding protein [Nocardioides coralli]QZY29232.1 ABC transporter substrate-binding protein [Nocardioides coralli]
MRTPRKRLGAVALAATLALTAAGCGQKAGVEQMYPAGVAVAPDGTVVGGVDAQGNPIGAGAAAGGGAGAGGAAGGASAGGGTGGVAGSGGDASVPTEGAPAGGGDTTGITADTIRIGVHAPVTGAAAIPQQSFQRAVGVYFDMVNRNGGFHGRKVQVVFEDDQFRPDVARAKCKEMAEQQKVFMLIGGAGSDQIDACARYAASVGVPYVSAGVHETRPGQAALGSLPTYFAVSLTYEQQVPLLARLYAKQFRGQPVAVLTADNDSLNGYHAAAVGAVRKAAGGSFEYEERVPKNTQGEAVSIGTRICNSGAKAVVWNASPSTLLNVVKAMPCTTTFVGPGLTNGLNVVAEVGCPNIDGAMFYSTFPGMDVMRQNATFVRAYQQKNGGAQPDDIGAAIYAIESAVGSILQAAGKNLSREGFMSTIGQKKSFQPGVLPPMNFTSRLGGTAMHLLQADCGRRQYVTVRQNERP